MGAAHATRFHFDCKARFERADRGLEGFDRGEHLRRGDRERGAAINGVGEGLQLGHEGVRRRQVDMFGSGAAAVADELSVRPS